MHCTCIFRILLSLPKDKCIMCVSVCFAYVPQVRIRDLVKCVCVSVTVICVKASNGHFNNIPLSVGPSTYLVLVPLEGRLAIGIGSA